jgi:hypothetical protein
MRAHAREAGARGSIRDGASRAARRSVPATPGCGITRCRARSVPTPFSSRASARLHRTAPVRREASAGGEEHEQRWRSPVQDRQGHLRTELFERYQRSEKALVGALAEMYVQGVSTRKVKAITEDLRGHEFSSATVSRINEHLRPGARVHQRSSRPHRVPWTSSSPARLLCLCRLRVWHRWPACQNWPPPSPWQPVVPPPAALPGSILWSPSALSEGGSLSTLSNGFLRPGVPGSSSS